VDSANIDDWLSTHAVQSSANPADALITLGDDTLTLNTVTVSRLQDGAFIVSPHHLT
jgi:NAD kinase